MHLLHPLPVVSGVGYELMVTHVDDPIHQLKGHLPDEHGAIVRHFDLRLYQYLDHCGCFGHGDHSPSADGSLYFQHTLQRDEAPF